MKLTAQQIYLSLGAPLSYRSSIGRFHYAVAGAPNVTYYKIVGMTALPPQAHAVFTMVIKSVRPIKALPRGDSTLAADTHCDAVLE